LAGLWPAWLSPGRSLALALLAILSATGLPAAAMAADPTATPCNAADAPSGPHIEVSVPGVRKVAGNVTFTLYGPRPEAFLARGGRLARLRVPLTSHAATACFSVSAPGTYAIAVYHDENNDHDFNRNFLGIPTEGYGFSNDAPTLAGLPSFDSVRFTVPAQGASLQVHLRY
jgi:uncharacterized protein (DUF2141 family)